jgi:LysR family transcriptional regulator, glycine cleavage system transcriptional activator
MRKLPLLTELRAFEAAARHLSFKQAAIELSVTPTAISHQIKLLEQHCGRPLFRRHPRPLTLTAAGEKLYPVIRDGFSQFAGTLSGIRGNTGERLRITATNAFAVRWLLPRLPQWRALHPRLRLDIVGTDTVLDLSSDEADIAIRYALRPPRDGHSVELIRDTFHVVASPKLVGKCAYLQPTDLAQLPIIEAGWPPTDTHAPTWQRWQRAAHPADSSGLLDLASLTSLRFQEELHAIEAAIAGQGVAICSNVLIARELVNGALVPVSPVALSGYGFYLVYRPRHYKASQIRKFVTFAESSVHIR